MANNTFVGFNLPTSGQSSTQSEVVKELQPVTTWSRDGNYKVTRRWRGPIDSLIAFSNGGSTNADFAGTYFTGTDTTGKLLGGAGRDGAITTELLREEGGQIGVFSATWVSSILAAAQWTGAPTAPATRGATTGDQFQESSLWTLDGNDLEKSVYECDIIKTCSAKLNASTPKSGNGFGARVKHAIDLYLAGKDKNGTALADPFQTKFDVSDYFNGVLSILAGNSSITGGTNLQTDLESLCEDILRGQEAFTISQYVLRNVITTQYTSSLIPHYANVNRIWSTANITTVITAETRPVDPPASATVVGTMPLLGVLGGTLSGANWLYRTPDVQELNNGKWQITREWWEGTEVSKNTYKAFGVA